MRGPPRPPLGLIPAHAGKTTWMFAAAAPVVGSSPLTRGKRESGPRSLAGGRLIPAHAGKTPTGWCRRQPARAHPRSRGENLIRSLSSVCSAGSSPLTRGKHAGRNDLDARQRLIPAHAGKTLCEMLTRASIGAHPRSRGENSKDGGFKWLASGSSPLTRGKQVRRLSHERATGLIPAHAGKTV